jgi:hypothetical protein
VTVIPMSLDGGSAGSVVVRSFGQQTSRVLLAATIADRAGVQVPYSYGATVGTTVATK